VLVDFGIARTLDDNAPGTLTRAGFRPISLRYASPEHLAGEPLTPASDVYSLGALLFQLLTGHPPAHAQVTPGEALDEDGAQALGFPDLPAARAAMAPYDAVTRRALAWRVEDRFPTARALAEALRDSGT
jgi:serine/threonine-protein kinase